MTSEELAALAEAVWQHEFAGGGTERRCAALLKWPYPQSLEQLNLELLRSDLGRLVGKEGWSAALAAVAEELADRALVVALCQTLYSDACETRRTLSWDDFASIVWKPEELELRLDGDPLVLGAVLQDRHIIKVRIGHGSFGVVYEAVDRIANQRLAIKGPRGAEREQRRRATRLLQREAEVLQAIGGAGTPAFREVVTIDGDLQVILMEYIEGVPLSRWLRETSATPKQAATLVGSLAETVHHLHRAGFVHRDLKPDNVIVRPDGRPCLVDMGVTFAEADRFTTEGRFAGTLNYVPPEGLLGMSSQLDGRSDIWALGAILYEVLTGDLLQQIDSREAALVASVAIHIDRPPFPPDVPGALQEICRRCLAREPNERFSSAEDLSAALLRWESAPEASSDQTSPQRLLGWRLGMKCGALLENLAYLGRRLHAMGDLPAAAGPIEGQAREHFGMARGFAMGVVIAYDDLCKLALEASVVLPPLALTRRVQELFYRKNQSVEAATWLREQLPELSTHYEAVYRTIVEALRKGSDAASACCELAARVTVLLLSQEDYGELDEAWRRTGIAGNDWQEFKETFERGPAAKEFLIRLEKGVERQLVFGQPAAVGEDDLFKHFAQ